MKINIYFEMSDWTIGVSWWRRKSGMYFIELTFNLLPIKIDINIARCRR